eukprot:TRINITY_DN3810_c0_g1_i1.p2 TRINITY_DN3810_c0_g1~~TRINITY_DN3810_c0_g1_i1.p2  ORF type:complete len:257 (-),score=59.54 TRINITY_DN3810_c0_g1_i1:27-797(-)
MVALAKVPFVSEFDFSHVKKIVSGGAPLAADLEDAVLQRFPHVKIVQLYGMTEVTGASHVVVDGNPRGSIGILVSLTQAKIISTDDGKTSLGVGQEGELWVKGPQVMKGYLANEEATKQTIDEDGWLHTGDIVTVDENGCFYVVDRLKELIKYKGYQVPPAELENKLLKHPLVDDVAVIGVPDEEAGELPKAYLVLKGGNEDSDKKIEEIAKWLEGEVAPHKKLRGGIEIIEIIPKSPSGKILRRVLRAKNNVKTK